MSTTGEAVSSADTSVEAYEELRNHVLAGSLSSSGSGLVVLLRQGVAAWVAQRRLQPPEVQPAVVLGTRVAEPLASELHAGIVRVLANMALASRQELSA